MWEQGLLGTKSAKTLMHTLYFYNGKLFGLRASEHRLLRLNNFELGDNVIKYTENICKTYHGGLKDLKKKCKVATHICHKSGDDHGRCLVKMYKMYFELVRKLSVSATAFYFQPFESKFGYRNTVVGVHSLAKIVPTLCEAIGVEKKTSHSLRITCATKLFQEGVEEKLIRCRTGHISSALFDYQKVSEEQEQVVSKVLGPVEGKFDTSENNKKSESSTFSADQRSDGYRPINISGACNVTIHNYK